MARHVGIPSLLLVILAGCAGPPAGEVEPPLSTATAPPALACTDPCDRTVWRGQDKSFEPDMAVDPLDPDHAVIAETPIPGEPVGVTLRSMSVYSTWDAGQTWERTWTSEPVVADPMHPLFSCALIGDAVAAFLPDGRLLVGGMAGTTVGTLSVFAMRSDDGGRTFPHFAWVDPAAPAAACGGDLVPDGGRVTESTDKPDLATAPDGSAVMSWHRLGVSHGEGPRPNGFAVSFSLDGGTTWGEPVSVPDSVWSLGYSMELLDAKTLEMASQESGEVHYLETTDGGATWRSALVGPTSNQYPSYARAGSARVVAFALYEGDAWTPVLATSLDGMNWTMLALAPPSPQYPMVAADADSDGTVFVSYWTTRGVHGNAIAREVTAWRDGSLGEPIRVDNTQQPERHDMTPVGYGHYQALAAFPGGAYAAWGAGPPALADLHAARVTVA